MDDLKILIYTKSNPFFQNMKTFFSFHKYKDVTKVENKNLLHEKSLDSNIVIIDLNIKDNLLNESLIYLSQNSKVFVIGYGIESPDSFYNSENSTHINLYIRKPPNKDNIPLILGEYVKYQPQTEENTTSKTEIESGNSLVGIPIIEENKITKEELLEVLPNIPNLIIEENNEIEEVIQEEIIIEASEGRKEDIDLNIAETLLLEDLPINKNDQNQEIVNDTLELELEVDVNTEISIDFEETIGEEIVESKDKEDNKVIEMKNETEVEVEKKEVMSEIDKIKKILRERNKRKDRHLTTKDIEKQTSVLSDKPIKEDPNIPLFIEEDFDTLRMYRVDEAIIKYRVKKLLEIGLSKEEVKENIKNIIQEDINVQMKIERKMEDNYGVSMREKRRKEMLKRLNFTPNILELQNKEKKEQVIEEVDPLKNANIKDIIFENKTKEVKPQGSQDIEHIKDTYSTIKKQEEGEVEKLILQQEKEKELRRKKEEEIRIKEEFKLQKEREKLMKVVQSADKYEEIFENDKEAEKLEIEKEESLKEQQLIEEELLRKLKAQEEKKAREMFENKFKKDDEGDYFSQTIKNNKKILKNNNISNNDFISFSDIEKKLPSQDLMSLHKAEKRKKELLEKVSENYKPKVTKKRETYNIEPPRHLLKKEEEDEKSKKKRKKKGLFNGLLRKNKK